MQCVRTTARKLRWTEEAREWGQDGAAVPLKCMRPHDGAAHARILDCDDAQHGFKHPPRLHLDRVTCNGKCCILRPCHNLAAIIGRLSIHIRLREAHPAIPEIARSKIGLSYELAHAICRGQRTTHRPNLFPISQ